MVAHIVVEEGRENKTKWNKPHYWAMSSQTTPSLFFLVRNNLLLNYIDEEESKLSTTDLMNRDYLRADLGG